MARPRPEWVVVLALLWVPCAHAMPARDPAAPPAPHVERVSGPLITHGVRARRWVALTFDADMTAGMRLALLERRQRTWFDHPLFRTLRRARAPATIFLTGLWAQRYAHFVRRMAAQPHMFELENHSLDHGAWEEPCYGLPPAADKRREVIDTARELRRLIGHGPRYFRFPGGCADAADVRAVESDGERPVGWDVVSGDAYLRDPAAVVRQVLTTVRPGSIVVAHCVGAPNAPATAAAMARLIPALRARGYRLVTLRRLLSYPGGAVTRASAASAARSISSRTSEAGWRQLPST